jgi:phosphatidylglycerophosphate synthase
MSRAVTTSALLFAHHADADSAEPWGALPAGGISVVERQARQARRRGATRILVVVERMSAGVAAAIERMGPDAQAIRDAAAIPALLAGDGDVLVFAEGLIVDDRLIDAALASPGPVLAAWRETRPHAERIDPAYVWAGVARLPSALVSAVAANLGEWDLQSTLLRSAVTEGTPLVDLDDLDDYAPERRRRVPLHWIPVRTAAEGAQATDVLLAAAQKGCLDWPARWLHPPVENALVRLLLPTRVTPNQITLLTGAVGIAAGAAFAMGALWVGLIVALLIGPLDGVDGKLARVRHEFSRWGDLEHVLDKVVEYGWYLCLAGWFAGQGHGGAWPIAAVIILFAVAEAVQGEFFRRFTGGQLDDAGVVERRIRLVAGRRNTFMWALLPFAIAGHWYAGFAVMAAYSAVTFFVAQARFFIRLAEYGRSHAPAVAANFAASGYAFLGDGKGTQ